MADEWELCQTYSNRVAAETLSGKLEAEGVPTRIDATVLDRAIETGFCVMVPRILVHRARWVLAQLPVTDAELDYLATGKLPGQKE